MGSIGIFLEQFRGVFEKYLEVEFDENVGADPNDCFVGTGYPGEIVEKMADSWEAFEETCKGIPFRI